MYAYHAAPWSTPSIDERDRRSHLNWTKQRAWEEMASWSTEEVEERIAWTWEEVLERYESLPEKQAEAAKEHQRRLRGSQPRRKQERQPQKKFWGGGHRVVGGARFQTRANSRTRFKECVTGTIRHHVMR
jgi:hypothetical protein